MSATPRLICIATHHKTGTIWMRNTFKAIAADQGLFYGQCSRLRQLDMVPDDGRPAILVNWSGRFPAEVFEHPEAVFLHMIRDPRDVLLSGERYHQTANTYREKFLEERRTEWGDMSYQEMIRALPTKEDRLRFEMNGKHAVTLQEMLAWPYKKYRISELRYEDLIEDTSCTLFREALERHEIPDFDVDRAVQCFWDKSLFGGAAKPGALTDWQKTHTRGGGKTGQWRNHLPRALAKQYESKYGAGLRALGYARDDSWVQECRVNVPEPEAQAS